MNTLSTIGHALYLSAVALSWIWKSVVFKVRGRFHSETIHFTRCWHCDERWSMADLIYCKRCLKAHQDEYAKEAEENAC